MLRLLLHLLLLLPLLTVILDQVPCMLEEGLILDLDEITTGMPGVLGTVITVRSLVIHRISVSKS